MKSSNLKAFSICISCHIVLHVNILAAVEYFGQRLPGNIFINLNNIGKRMCVKECEKFSLCQSVNYNKNQLLCELNKDANITFLESSTNFIYISKHGAEILDNVTQCQATEVQVILKSNEQTCVRVLPKCVTNGTNWMKFQSLCYKVIETKHEFSEVQTICGSYGATLIAPRTQVELEYFSQYSTGDGVYVDVTEKEHLVYRLRSGQLVPSTFWCPGEPYGDQCAALTPKNGCLNDLDCNTIINAICVMGFQYP